MRDRVCIRILLSAAVPEPPALALTYSVSPTVCVILPYFADGAGRASHSNTSSSRMACTRLNVETHPQRSVPLCRSGAAVLVTSCDIA